MSPVYIHTYILTERCCRHPTKLALDVVLDALPTDAGTGGFEEAASKYSATLSIDDVGVKLQNLAVSHHAHAIRKLLLATSRIEGQAASVLVILRICVQLLQSAAIRDSFAEKVTLPVIVIRTYNQIFLGYFDPVNNNL